MDLEEQIAFDVGVEGDGFALGEGSTSPEGEPDWAGGDGDRIGVHCRSSRVDDCSSRSVIMSEKSVCCARCDC